MQSEPATNREVLNGELSAEPLAPTQCGTAGSRESGRTAITADTTHAQPDTAPCRSHALMKCPDPASPARPGIPFLTHKENALMITKDLVPLAVPDDSRS